MVLGGGWRDVRWYYEVGGACAKYYRKKWVGHVRSVGGRGM